MSAPQVLGAHDVVGAAVGLAGDDRDLRDGRLGVGVDQLGAAADDAVPLLLGAGQEAGHVDEGQHRDVERVAGPHEPGGLLGRVDVQRAGELHRLVGDDADRAALDPAEADDDVRREQRLHLEELPVVEDVLDDRVHVVGLVGRVRDERVELEVDVGDLEVGRRRRTTAPRRGCCSAGRTAAPWRSSRQSASSRGHGSGRRRCLVLCVRAPPRSSKPTSSPVTVLMTSGPVMNMCEVLSTISVKSVMAGE